MRWLARTSHRLRSIFRKDAVEQALNEEVRFHLERQIAERSGGPKSGRGVVERVAQHN